jgi:hypothetical protein
MFIFVFLAEATATEIPDKPEQIDPDGRLSIEFANHNWFMEKYKLQTVVADLKRAQPVNQIALPKQNIKRKQSRGNNSKPKKKKRHRMAQNMYQLPVLNTDDNHIEATIIQSRSTAAIACPGPIFIQTVKESDSTNDDMHHLCNVRLTASVDHEQSDSVSFEPTQLQVDSDKSTSDLVSRNDDAQLQILEVVSLAGYVTREPNNPANETTSSICKWASSLLVSKPDVDLSESTCN